MVKKISIIGAGAVGSTLAFHILNRLNIEELVLVDISGNLAKGVALDLEDTRGILGFTTKVKGTKNFAHIKDSDIIVNAAGIARKEGMTRLDLLKTNAKVARQIAGNIKKLCPFSIVIAVTNPLDLITYVLTKETKFPRTRVLGMGAGLDTSRMKNLLSQVTGITTSSLEGYVFGLHSKDMIVSKDRIRIDGESLSKFLSKEKIDGFTKRVQMRGAEIVSNLKNKSASFAPSLAACKLIEAIYYNKNELIPVSIQLNGEYGLKKACMSVPCVINRKGVEKIVELDLTASEKNQIKEVKKLFDECMNLL